MMNGRGIYGKGFLMFFVALLGLTIGSSALATPKDIKLEIESDQLVVKSKKRDNGCGIFTTGGIGCIKFKKNEKATISFNLVGDTKCNLDDGQSWVLNAVYLGGYDSANKPVSSGFSSTAQADFDKVNADFGGVDKATGLVTPTYKGDTKITINNDNSSKYVVWYQVEALCTRGEGKPPHKSTTDPRIRNGGTG